MSGAACNIAPSGRRRRAVMGVAALAAALSILVLFDDRLPSPPWGRLVVLPLVFFAALCLFQAQADT